MAPNPAGVPYQSDAVLIFMTEPELVIDRLSRFEMSPSPFTAEETVGLTWSIGITLYVSALETGTVTPEKAE